MSDTPRLDQSLTKATREYASLDKRIKTLEGKKKKARDRFFALATKKLSRRKSVRRTEEFIETSDMLVHDYVARFFPAYKLEGWQKLDVDPDKGRPELPSGQTYIRATLVEDPEKSKFTFVNEESNIVFGRTYEMRGSSFDTKRFVEDHPELAQRCCMAFYKESFKPGDWELHSASEPIPAPKLENSPVDIEAAYTLDEKLANKIMSEEPETVTIFQQYADPGKLNVKMSPMRAAKEEDLNG